MAIHNSTEMGVPMELVSRASQWRTVHVSPHAWRQSHLIWDPQHLIDLAGLASSSASASEFAPALISKIVTHSHLRAWEAVNVDSEGGLHRDRAESHDSGLIAWGISCLWGDEAVAEALRVGSPHVEVRDSRAEADLIACLPLIHGQVLDSVIAAWITTRDIESAIECASRLTLVGHLWSTIGFSACDLRAGGEQDQIVSPGLNLLTTRQLLILRAMAEGLTNSQIAQQINFSESTVRLESMCIYRHFGVHSRSEAVTVARAVGEL